MDVSTTPDIDESPATADEFPPPPSRPFTAIGGYEIVEEIGRGAMGVVYRARHIRLGRIVALKLLRAGALAGPAERERFLREARAGAGLQHPAIVQVFEVGEADGSPYLALEYVPNVTLARKLSDGPLAPRDAAALIAALADAVQYAHKRGVVHRDLKPANILLKDSADAVEPKIADFSLARLRDDPGATDPGTVLGTPAYMAPEQAAGRAAEAGPPADVYALGAILYECVTGVTPFQAPTHFEMLRRVLTEEPARASRIRHAVPRDLDTICLTCLQKDPWRRYASAAALAADLRRFLDGRPILARPVGPWGRTVRWVRRNPRVAALLALLAVALTAAVFQWRRSERLFILAEGQRDAAEANLSRYRQAADDFAGLLDSLDSDQLFHLRWSPLRKELVVPALERNREFLRLHEGDADRRADVVRAHFRVAMMTRMLGARNEPGTRQAALEAGQRALAALEAFAGAPLEVVQFRRDRAALTHNLGHLLHANGKSADALPVLTSACQQRQELLDSQRDNLDYQSELGGCWNDRGLALFALRRYDESVIAQGRAIELQSATVAVAPQVPRYRMFLCNHHFNRATALRELNRGSESVADVAESCRLLPHDPEQWYRKARVLASLHARTDAVQYADAAIADLRRAIDLGLTDRFGALSHEDLNSIRARSEFDGMIARLAKAKND